MNLTKKQRASLYDKYGGKCAYCGCELPPRWHADHIEPIYRNTQIYDNKTKTVIDATRNHLDVIDNLNPACPACNNYKHTLALEEFRSELSKQVERAMNNCNFKLALKYKQITINKSPIVFYFERVSNHDKDNND